MVSHFDTPHWQAEFVPEKGGQLVRLRHRRTGRDILYYPATPEDYLRQPERHGMPFLFPPNRIAGGRFSWRGHDYSLPLNEPERGNHIHGITLNQPWTFDTTAGDSDTPATATLTLTHTSAHPTYQGYPHSFGIKLTHEFFPDEVRQTVCLKNMDEAGTAPQPYGLGFHTAFFVPPSTRARLRITAAQDGWELHPGSRQPTGRKTPFPLATIGHPFIHPAPLTGSPISCHAPATTEKSDAGFFRGAILEFPEENLTVTYRIGEDFRHWFLWMPPDASDCLCLEPMSWMVNAPNLHLPPEITGLRYLKPKESREFRTSIHLSLGAIA